MNVQVEDLSPVKKKVSVEVSAERVTEEILAAYKKIAQKAKIKGFRKGKVPMSVVERYFEAEMEQEVIGKLIHETYYQALIDNNIDAIAHPSIEKSGELKKDQPFSYDAHVEVKPDVKAKDYTGLSLKKEIFAEDDAALESQIADMLSSRAEMRIADHDEAINGDFVTLDFEGFVDGVAFEHGAAQDHELELGSGTFIPGFEEQLVGMKRGEEKEIAVTFPEQYGNKDLAGKAATFKVAIKELKVKVVPELTDELAKEFGGESVDDLREKMAENNRNHDQRRIEEDLKERLMTALSDANPIEVPDTMVERQLDFMYQNIGNRLKSQGMTLQMMGLNEQSFRAMYRSTATKQVQGSLLLEAIGRQENISVDDSEIDSRLEEIAEMANAPLDEVKKYYASEEARQGLLAQIEEEKVITWLLGQSSVSEVSKDELKGSAEDAEEA